MYDLGQYEYNMSSAILSIIIKNYSNNLLAAKEKIVSANLIWIQLTRELDSNSLEVDSDIRILLHS